MKVSGFLVIDVICDYEATERGSLFKHKKSKHDGVKFPCHQCDYKATQKGNLLTHIKSINEGLMFPCDQCDFKGRCKAYLSKHLLMIVSKSLVIIVITKQTQKEI